MAYDLDLESRIDEVIDALGDITKKKMFGGVGYLLNGNMCFGIHKDELVVRTSKEKADELLKQDEVRPFDITGRPMKGWILVSQDILETDEELSAMLLEGSQFATTLPPK